MKGQAQRDFQHVTMAGSQTIFQIRTPSESHEEEDANEEELSTSYYTTIGTDALSSFVTIPDAVFFRPGEDCVGLSLDGDQVIMRYM